MGVDTVKDFFEIIYFKIRIRVNLYGIQRLQK